MASGRLVKAILGKTCRLLDLDKNRCPFQWCPTSLPSSAFLSLAIKCSICKMIKTALRPRNWLKWLCKHLTLPELPNRHETPFGDRAIAQRPFSELLPLATGGLPVFHCRFRFLQLPATRFRKRMLQ